MGAVPDRIESAAEPAKRRQCRPLLMVRLRGGRRLICREPHTRTAPRLALYRNANGTDRFEVVRRRHAGDHRAPSMPRVRVLTTSSPQRCSIFRTVPLRVLTTTLSYLPAPRPRARRAPPPVATYVLTTALSYLPAPRPRARRAPPPVATSDGWAREIGREIEPTRHLAGCSRGG